MHFKRKVIVFSSSSSSSRFLLNLSTINVYRFYVAHNVCLPQIRGGGGLLSPKFYVDVPASPRKSVFLYTNFLPNFPPISIPFSILNKLGAFYNNLPKIHPIYIIWAPSSLMTPPHRYTKVREKAPQNAGTYTYIMSMWDPPGRKWSMSKFSGCTIASDFLLPPSHSAEVTWKSLYLIIHWINL